MGADCLDPDFVSAGDCFLVFISQGSDDGLNFLHPRGHCLSFERVAEKHGAGEQGEGDDGDAPGEAGVDVEILDEVLEDGGGAPAEVDAADFFQIAYSLGYRSYVGLGDVCGRIGSMRCGDSVFEAFQECWLMVTWRYWL